MAALAPIALFVYNRPDHTRRTLNALAQNRLANVSDLFVFSDGPKSSEDEGAVLAVRDVLAGAAGFRSVTPVFQAINQGLAASIIHGVTRLCDEFGQVIVLEDDLLTAPDFLEFMNRALDRYRNDERVMHISGYMFPVERPATLPETFFYRGTSCWGWATWQRAWTRFNPDGNALLASLREASGEHRFDIQGSGDFTGMLKLQTAGKIDSWAIRWYASVFLADGLCLHPARSLVRNIGHDGSGVHCGRTSVFEVDLAAARLPAAFPDRIEECAMAVAAMAAFYGAQRPPYWRRALSSLRQCLLALFGRGR